jgi:hypothetical protein
MAPARGTFGARYGGKKFAGFRLVRQTARDGLCCRVRFHIFPFLERCFSKA